MSLVDQAVETIEGWGTERKKERAQCTKHFKLVLKQMDRAIAVWEKFLEKAPESGDQFTAVMWMGPKPAKRLHAIYLDNKATAIALTEITGVRFKDSLSLAEDLDIVQPYDQLGPDESGSDRAKAAIRVMTARKERIEAALTRLGA